MPFAIGVRRLSQLVIDTVKNWGGQRIDNVGAPDSDDDVPRARAGDILSGRFPVSRLPDGPSGQVLTGQGTGVNPVYAALSAARIAAGSFTGDGTQADRQITVGFACKLVYVKKRSATIGGWITVSQSYGCLGLAVGGYSIANSTSLYLHAADGFVVNLYGAAGLDINVNGAVYDYAAIG